MMPLGCRKQLGRRPIAMRPKVVLGHSSEGVLCSKTEGAISDLCVLEAHRAQMRPNGRDRGLDLLHFLFPSQMRKTRSPELTHSIAPKIVSDGV